MGVTGATSVDAKQLLEMAQEHAKLVAFKAYVHRRLDDAGVPADPEPESNAQHGCRIEGRLNVILSRKRGTFFGVCDERDALRKQLAEQRAELVGARAEAAALRRERDAAHSKLDQLEERARVAELQEMVGVAREMTAVGFVSRDLVQRAFELLADEPLSVHCSGARVLLREALGR